MRKKLPVEEYRKVQELAAEEIAKLPGDVIIDTHASIRFKVVSTQAFPTG